MYKNASRRTGGAATNGRAKVAKTPSKSTLERAASQTALGRSLVLDSAYYSSTTIAQLSLDKVGRLILDLVEGYTNDKTLVKLAKRLQSSSHCLTRDEMGLAAIALKELVGRLTKYRTRQD